VSIHKSLLTTCTDSDESCYDFLSSWNRGFSRTSYGGGDSVMPGIGLEEGSFFPQTGMIS
jgi:hypothetical protein